MLCRVDYNHVACFLDYIAYLVSIVLDQLLIRVDQVVVFSLEKLSHFLCRFNQLDLDFLLSGQVLHHVVKVGLVIIRNVGYLVLLNHFD